MDLSQRMGIEMAMVPEEDEATGAIVPAYWIDMKNYHHAVFIFDLNADNTATTAIKLRQADNAAGDNPVDITGKTATVGGAAQHYQETLDLSSAEVNAVNPAKQFVGIHVTTGQNDDDVAAVFVGMPQRYT